jgi:hypothetical protein
MLVRATDDESAADELRADTRRYATVPAGWIV